MKFLVFFGILMGLFSTVTAATRCIEIFPDDKYLQSLVDHNYFYNPGISDLMKRVRNLNVRFEFWDPTEGGTVTMHNRFVEPLIVESFHDRRFIPEETIIYFPYDHKQLFGKLDSNYRIRQILIRVARIFELQKQGVLFSAESLRFNEQITIVGFAPVLTMDDPTLVAMTHLFTHFKYRRVSFEPRDSRWEYYDFSPERNYVTNPLDDSEMLIRIAYFEREELWEYLSQDLERFLFSPSNLSLFRNPEESLN